MDVNGKFHALTSLLSRGVGGWVGPRAGLGDVTTSKILSF